MLKRFLTLLTVSALLLSHLQSESYAQTQLTTKDYSAMNADLIKIFAPTGVLRASLNVGNPVLANRRLLPSARELEHPT